MAKYIIDINKKHEIMTPSSLDGEYVLYMK